MGLSKRDTALMLARIAGYHNDVKAFTRLRIERRVNVNDLNLAWHAGVRAKVAGVTCACRECNPSKEGV